MVDQQQSSQWRRLVLLGAPLLGLVATILHPRWESPTTTYNAIAPQVELWTDLHVAQLVIFGLLALALYYWLEPLTGRAARVGRIALACFVVFYPAFDALVGIGTGVMIQTAQQLDPSQLAAAQELINKFWDNVNSATVAGTVAFVGAMAWAAAVLSIVLARTSAARRLPAAVVAIIAWLLLAMFLTPPLSPDLPPIALGTILVVVALVMAIVAPPRILSFWLTIAALAFGFAHIFPAGTIGMVALLAADALAEFMPSLRATRQPVPAPSPALES